MLNHLTIKNKFLLTISLMYLFLMVLVIVKIVNEVETYQTLDRLTRYISLSEKSNQLIHELQKERGISAGFLASKGTNAREQLLGQRKLVDAKLLILEEYYEQIRGSGLKQSVIVDVQNSLNHLQNLAETRQQVDQLKYSVGQSVTWYSKSIRLLLNLLTQSRKSIDINEVSNLLLHYNYITNIKESAGLERATINSILNKQQVDKVSFQKLIMLIQIQDSFITEFKVSASPQELALYDTLLEKSKFAEFYAIRTAVVESELGSSIQSDPKQWWAVSTNRVDAFHEVEVKLATNLHETLESLKSDAIYTVTFDAVLFIAIMLGSLLLIFYIFKDANLKLKKAMNSLNRFSSGELLSMEKLDKAEHQDEISTLIKHVYIMSAKISEIVMGVLNCSTELTQCSTNIKSGVGALVQNPDTIKKQAQSISSASEQISSNMNNTAAAAEEISTNMRDINLSNRLVLDNTQKNLEQLWSSVESLKQLKAKIGESEKRTQHAVKDTKQTLETVQQLEQSANEIGGVVKLINDIANQTRMLALNATIEAASAGDAGKGFSVVAAEVKHLAQQTSEANNQIGNQIQFIQQLANTALESTVTVNQSIKELDSSNQFIAASIDQELIVFDSAAQNADQNTKALNGVLVKIQEGTIALNEVAKLISEASKGARDSFGEIKKMQQLLTSMTDELVSANGEASQLVGIADQLKRLIGYFKADPLHRVEAVPKAMIPSGLK